MERRTVARGGSLRGVLELPGDKSLTHRALLFGALAGGPSRIRKALRSADTACTLGAMLACGADIVEDGDGLVIDPPPSLIEPANVIDCGNSGTTIRLLTGLFAAQAGRFFVVTGDASLRRRPMARVVEPLRKLGAHITGRQNADRAPLAVDGQALVPGHVDLTIASAQLKSAVLLASLRQGVSLTQPGESRDHTERMLRALGATLSTDRGRIVLEPVSALSAFDWSIPGDVSSAAFWLVGASLAPGSMLSLRDVGLNPTRTGAIDVLRNMGADLTVTVTDDDPEPRGDIEVRPADLRGTVIAGSDTLRALDEIPVLAVAAAFADGVTTIRDAAELRVKESDRLARVADGLRAMGVEVEDRPDGLVIEGRPGLRDVSGEAFVDADGDHRIAMAFAIAGHLRGGITLAGADEVVTSYPSFFEDLDRLSGGQESG